MFRVVTVLALVSLVLIPLACDKSPHKKFLDQGLAVLERINAVLEGITDEESAQAARPELEGLAVSANGYREQYEAAGEPPEELQAFFKDRMEPLQKALSANLMRIALLDGAMKHVQPALEKMSGGSGSRASAQGGGLVDLLSRNGGMTADGNGNPMAEQLQESLKNLPAGMSNPEELAKAFRTGMQENPEAVRNLQKALANAQAQMQAQQNLSRQNSPTQHSLKKGSASGVGDAKSVAADGSGGAGEVVAVSSGAAVATSTEGNLGGRGGVVKRKAPEPVNPIAVAMMERSLGGGVSKQLEIIKTSTEPSARIKATNHLGILGLTTRDPEALEGLVGLIEDLDPKLRDVALEHLMGFHDTPEVEAALPKVVAFVSQRENSLAALQLIQRVGEPAQKFGPTIVQALEAEKERQRQAAMIRALRGMKSKDALPVLRKFAAGDDAFTQRVASDAIRAIEASS